MPFARRTLVSVALAAVVAAAPLPAGGSQDACATGHLGVHLGDFAAQSVSGAFYWAAEDTGTMSFVIRVSGHDCATSPVSVAYATRDGTATTGADYVPATGRTVVFSDPTHSGKDRQPVPVSLSPDALPEPVVETAHVALSAPEGGYLTDPVEASLHIVDDDGLGDRVSLDGGTYRQVETFPHGGVPVFRAGPASGSVSVDYAISAGPAPSASPGRDAGPASGRVTFGPGERVQLIPVTVVDDREAEPSEQLTISLTGATAAVEPPTTSTFTIVDNEENIPPQSRLHHPRNKRKYRAKDHRLREIHVFTTDAGGSLVVGADLAIRRNLRAGSCRWWTGKRWRKRSCTNAVWLGMDRYEPDFFYYRLRRLRPTRGPVRSYTAFSRAIDGARNREAKFEAGRNANDFRVR